ncbi:polyprenyl synthetase family protein [Metallumcola ferriviriculae]|uniref:Polyprenyl synthetase family protein n=1 Tax=Metallumcola ferriviriculae TaxID=3039180 RepID=A0AAU0UUB2_9FIRM|nr:polyprenyl synthetase family protein [Desulfitibacteraceae bacterium MK1]
MTFKFIESVLPELREMERIMDRDFRLRAGHITRFVSLELDKADKYLYPGMLLLSAKMLGAASTAKSLPLAAVVQFVRLAGHVHGYDGRSPQYPVLVGDYLYSHFFLYLSRYDCLEMLAPLSAAICDIHEGGIIRKDVLEEGIGSVLDYTAVAEKEWGSLLAECCTIGAAVADAPHQETETIRAFGRNFGTAWGILRSGFSEISPAQYLIQARQALNALPKTREKTMLLRTVDTLEHEPELMKNFMAG